MTLRGMGAEVPLPAEPRPPSGPGGSPSATASSAAVDGIDLRDRARRVLRLPRPERRRQDHHDADALVPRAARRRRAARCSASTPTASPGGSSGMLGVVAQDTTLDLELTVRENLLVYARYFDVPRAEAATRADELLRLMALDDRADDAVERLSGGMRRRLQIARALINRPRLVLLDEPTTGPRPPGAPRRVGAAAAAARRRRDARADHPLHGRGGPALRPAGDHGPRPHRPRWGAPTASWRAEVGREVLELRVAPADVAALLAHLDGGARPRGGRATCWCCSPTTPRPSTPRRAGAGVPIRLQAARGRRAGGRVPARSPAAACATEPRAPARGPRAPPTPRRRRSPRLFGPRAAARPSGPRGRSRGRRARSAAPSAAAC